MMSLGYLRAPGRLHQHGALAACPCLLDIIARALNVSAVLISAAKCARAVPRSRSSPLSTRRASTPFWQRLPQCERRRRGIPKSGPSPDRADGRTLVSLPISSLSQRAFVDKSRRQLSRRRLVAATVCLWL